MATIKSYTDLEQSKKLAEFLPLESADMYYECTKEEPEYKVYVGKNIAIAYNLFSYRNGHTIPCWSLASLLSVLPVTATLLKDGNISSIGDVKYHIKCPKGNIDKCFDNPVDACVAMVEKLNELNLL